ncbi:uncharacterized protein LOC127138207 [Lathyrus oleraceus]|uniref:uncharacterized protein LOC127138207 n=1 Tax=Pisum sativum TaxID=3888 RepID=UPI0021CEDD30|nr:uncharacterized protein LOC127138207 [Pisum sativum]
MRKRHTSLGPHFPLLSQPSSSFKPHTTSVTSPLNRPPPFQPQNLRQTSQLSFFSDLFPLIPPSKHQLRETLFRLQPRILRTSYSNSVSDGCELARRFRLDGCLVLILLFMQVMVWNERLKSTGFTSPTMEYQVQQALRDIDALFPPPAKTTRQIAFTFLHSSVWISN